METRINYCAGHYPVHLETSVKTKDFERKYVVILYVIKVCKYIAFEKSTKVPFL